MVVYNLVRYASLRGRLLVDPHILKDESNAPNLVMDNPLSQNPGKPKHILSPRSCTLLVDKSISDYNL